MDLIRTLQDPDVVFASLDDINTALICAGQDHIHDIVAVLRVSTNKMFQNSVITARRQRISRRGKPFHRNMLVWAKVGEK